MCCKVYQGDGQTTHSNFARLGVADCLVEHLISSGSCFTVGTNPGLLAWLCPYQLCLGFKLDTVPARMHLEACHSRRSDDRLLKGSLIACHRTRGLATTSCRPLGHQVLVLQRLARRVVARHRAWLKRSPQALDPKAQKPQH